MNDRPVATNHAGWHVEELLGEDGWYRITSPVTEREYAESIRDRLAQFHPDREFRVYETLIGFHFSKPLPEGWTSYAPLI